MNDSVAHCRIVDCEDCPFTQALDEGRHLGHNRTDETNFMLPEEVFITDGYPEHTYVALEGGQKEDEISEGLEQKNKIISVSGPSKSGKTTLCNRLLGMTSAERMYMTGDAVGKADDLWLEAYQQVTDETEPGFHELSHTKRIERLIDAGIPLVIDDFHYIPHPIQPTISRQMKNAASAGLRIVCLTVPHRGDDPIRNNHELSGRFFSVTFEFWTDEELAQIAEIGFPQVGFPSVPEFNSLLAREALKSPQIMQTLCLEACRSQNPDRSLESVKPTNKMFPKIVRRAIRSYDQRSVYDLLRQGPPTRGSERRLYRLRAGGRADVYECLLKSLRENPPFLNLGLDELRERMRNLLVDTKEPNIRSALQQYKTLFKDQPLPIDWDDEKRRLTIVDPHFYFFLRNH